jgi:hypothetical protein
LDSRFGRIDQVIDFHVGWGIECPPVGVRLGDELELLPSASPSICLMGADDERSRVLTGNNSEWRAPDFIDPIPAPGSA